MRVLLITLFTAAAVSLLGSFLGMGLPHRWAPLGYAVPGLICGIQFYLLVRKDEAQRKLVVRRIGEIENLNHHVRNSLQIIVGCLWVEPGTAASHEKCRVAVERIDRTLKGIK